MFNDRKQPRQYLLPLQKTSSSEARGLRVSEQYPECSSELVLREGRPATGQVLVCSSDRCEFREPAERRMARLMDRTLSLQRQVIRLGGDVLEGVGG